jgi:hypothetical protein
MPNAGDSVKVSVTNTVSGGDLSISGAAASWDFTALTPNNQRFERFDNPGTFPSPYNFLFNPANTSYGKDNYQNTGNLAPGFTVDAAYDFFREQIVNYRQIGAAFTINGTPIPFVYQKPDTIYEFPINYMNVDSCDYRYGLAVPGFGYYGQKGHRVNMVDGWGTITTPYGAFSALRVKSTITAIDTVYSSAFGFGTNIPRPLRNEYKWLASGMKIPVLYVDESGGVVTNVVYIDSVRAGVPQVGIAELADQNELIVYPNPASENASVLYRLSSASRVKITVMNVLGQELSVLNDNILPAGKHRFTIDLNSAEFQTGIYFICIERESKREVKKLIVQK